MAKLASTVALKGQSRSTFCAATSIDPRVKGRACRRLAGHKGDHRTTTQRSKGATKIVAVKAPKVTQLAEAEATRMVAAPAGRTKSGGKHRTSGKPVLSRPVVG